MVDIRKIVKSRKLRGKIMYGLRFLPDPVYVSLFYFAVIGELPNLHHPTKYNEKLQWLKLHDKHPEYSILVDKLKVRSVIEEKIGSEYLIPLLGYWESFDQIDFSALPDEFVLKCNHDSGSARIVYDKKTVSPDQFEELKQFFDNRMKHDFFYAGREYPYKGIKRYVIAEKLLKDSSGTQKEINDYKFFCFDGCPRIMLTVSGRQTGKHEDYFDMSYHWLRNIRNGSIPSEQCPPKPAAFEQMKIMAAELSKGMKQVRLDFYEIGGHIYFGEYTFFSGGGFERFYPEEWEKRMGDWIIL